MRNVNIPIFIPHEGCKNACVFCNQKTITGTSGKADRNIRLEIDKALSTISPYDKVMIAFFGGSFTGLDKSLMTSLCDTAYDYVKKGLVSSVRLSTRPDYIDESILEILKQRGVTNIELGIQSMSQKVLDASKRGHKVEDTIKACRLINDYGFTLGGQMMVGLPTSTIEDEIYTAEQIVSLDAKETRIYPTVVFHGTELCNMAKNGTYSPLTLEDAIKRSAHVYGIFKNAGIKVLRVGLQSSESLCDDTCVYAGPNHPSLGELVMGEYYYKQIMSKKDDIARLIRGDAVNYRLNIYCHPSYTSKIIGNKSVNLKRYYESFSSFGIRDIKVINNKDFHEEQIDFSIETI